MKAKTRILLLLAGLIVPYMIFVLSFALRLPPHTRTLPKWFTYVAACYFFGIIFSFPFLRKKVLAGAPLVPADEQRVQNASAARAVRLLGYIWLIGPVGYLLNGGPLRNPWWVSVLGLSWPVFLSWASFRAARKIELKTRQIAV